MIMQFTKEEKDKLTKTLSLVVEDLRSIYNIAETNKISYEFEVWENESLNKYTKESTIEVELPETNNKPVLEVRSEEGKNVGRVTIGPVSLKILTSENVSIVDRNQQAKVKKK